VNTSRLGS